ncbi:MAG TPA: hypothetical protein PLI95_27180 [Polyangiaceae bacterium]|nr:hypothetical protein [Polyangiaceae bacterium]
MRIFPPHATDFYKTGHIRMNPEGTEFVYSNFTPRSARGLLRVELEDGEYVLHDQQTPEQEQRGELRLVFRDGVAYQQQTLSDIRARLVGPNF